MAVLKTLRSEVELLVQFPQVGLAISDSTAPVPGYLYGEINAITYMDYGNNCKPLVNFLISRLQENTPFASFKILKLLLHLVKNGHTEIVDEVKTHEIPLKAAMSFHGPPHNLHGKTFYENVRKLSKELLEYLYSENKEVSDNIVAPSISDLSGYGSNANTQGLPGFGFSVQSPKSVSEKITEGVSNLVEKLLPTNERESMEEQASHLKENLPYYKPLIINKAVSESENISSSVIHSLQKSTYTNRMKPKRVYKPGKPGGGWAESDDEEDESINVVQLEESCKGSSASFDCIEISKLEVKENIVDWVDEHKVVDSFVVNEPLHFIDFSSVTSLCKGCSLLNCDKVLMFLLDKLEEKEELVQLRALILIEYLIHNDIVSLESLLKIVSPPLDNLVEKADDLPKSVKTKAKKVSLIIRNLSKTSTQSLPIHNAQSTIKCQT